MPTPTRRNAMTALYSGIAHIADVTAPQEQGTNEYTLLELLRDTNRDRNQLSTRQINRIRDMIIASYRIGAGD